jgi:hypothetical protein
VAKIFLGQPCYGSIEMESADAVEKALGEDSPHELAIVRLSSSLLANCFNTLLATCLESNREDSAAGRTGFRYFAMLHADVAPEPNWLDVLIAELEQYGLDVIHAPCAMKNGKGHTSTAIAYSDDAWEPVRRLTTTELAELWPTFTIRTLREQLDPSAWALLPNTGCMLWRLGPWVDNFPGFEIRDRQVFASSPGHSEPHWQAWTVSEDWNFGFWAAANDVRVGATTKVRTKHIGRTAFKTGVVWGEKRDEMFFELRAAAAKAA